MGALHAGHIALVDEARRRADRVVATIFVNPAQFGPGEDLDRYPRREEADADMLGAAGCDLLWLPAVADIYPDGFATTVSVSGLSDRWEGEARPGHFDGVATVVAKLLLTVRPDVALFGEKDFQQLAVIRRMVRTLASASRSSACRPCATRTASRCRRAMLICARRTATAALALPQALAAARDAIVSGEAVEAALDDARDKLGRAGFSRVDYVALVDAETLEPLDRAARRDAPDCGGNDLGHAAD